MQYGYTLCTFCVYFQSWKCYVFNLEKSNIPIVVQILKKELFQVSYEYAIIDWHCVAALFMKWFHWWHEWHMSLALTNVQRTINGWHSQKGDLPGLYVSDFIYQSDFLSSKWCAYRCYACSNVWAYCPMYGRIAQWNIIKREVAKLKILRVVFKQFP